MVISKKDKNKLKRKSQEKSLKKTTNTDELQTEKVEEKVTVKKWEMYLKDGKVIVEEHDIERKEETPLTEEELLEIEDEVESLTEEKVDKVKEETQEEVKETLEQKEDELTNKENEETNTVEVEVKIEEKQEIKEEKNSGSFKDKLLALKDKFLWLDKKVQYMIIWWVVIVVLLIWVFAFGWKNKTPAKQPQEQQNTNITDDKKSVTPVVEDEDININEDLKAISYNVIPLLKKEEQMVNNLTNDKKISEKIVISANINNKELNKNTMFNFAMDSQQNTKNIEWVSEDEDKIAKGTALSPEDEEKLTDAEKLKRLWNPVLSLKKYNGVKWDLTGNFKATLKVKPIWHKEKTSSFKISWDISTNSERTDFQLKDFWIASKNQTLVDKSQLDKFLVKGKYLFFNKTETEDKTGIKNFISVYEHERYIQKLLSFIGENVTIEWSDKDVNFPTEMIKTASNWKEDEQVKQEDVKEENDKSDETENTEKEIKVKEVELKKLTEKSYTISANWEQIKNIIENFANSSKVLLDIFDKTYLDKEEFLKTIKDEDSIKFEYSVKENKALVSWVIAWWNINWILGNDSEITLTNWGKTIRMTQKYSDDKLTLEVQNDLYRTIYSKELSEKNNIYKLDYNFDVYSGKKKISTGYLKSILSKDSAELPVYVKINEPDYYKKDKYEVRSNYIISEYNKILNEETQMLKQEKNNSKENSTEEKVEVKENETKKEENKVEKKVEKTETENKTTNTKKDNKKENSKKDKKTENI